MLDKNCIEVSELSKHYHGSEIGSVHALSDVSFNVGSGESIGIVGHNGAGKSTLLKVLSRITPPTSGDAYIKGNLTSLLEVGTGLHPELSGTDNILLYGSILGLSFGEIHKIQPQIIEFSGLADSVKLPVKKFSSGMKLRLAFSVIAHLPVDIIALDEVLAVGDSMFQQRCMQRMMDIKKGGHTLLFVSHDLSAVRSLCDRTIVLEKGKKVFDGATEEAINFYRSTAVGADPTTDLLHHRKGSEKAWFASVKFNLKNLKTGTPLIGKIEIESTTESPKPNAEIGINIRSLSGSDLYHISNRFIGQNIELNARNSVEFNIEHQLKPGKYSVSLYLKADDVEQQWIQDAAIIEVTGNAPYGFLDGSQIQSDLAPNFKINHLK